MPALIPPAAEIVERMVNDILKAVRTRKATNARA